MNKYQEIAIPVSNQELLCKLFVPSIEPRLTMIMVHGWTSSDAKYPPLGERLTSKGIAALAINLRGHADSPFELKQFSRSDHQQDVLSALKYMRERFPNTKVCLLGKSYGGYLSATVATSQLIDFLILAQPALYPDEGFNDSTCKLIEANPEVFRVFDQTPSNNRAIKTFSEFSNPVLFITSEKDEEIPQSTTQNYLDFAQKQVTKIELKDADHSLTRTQWREEFYTAITDWIDLQILK